jgi:hypothetical protein
VARFQGKQLTEPNSLAPQATNNLNLRSSPPGFI